MCEVTNNPRKNGEVGCHPSANAQHRPTTKHYYYCGSDNPLKRLPKKRKAGPTTTLMSTTVERGTSAGHVGQVAREVREWGPAARSRRGGLLAKQIPSGACGTQVKPDENLTPFLPFSRFSIYKAGQSVGTHPGCHRQSRFGVARCTEDSLQRRTKLNFETGSRWTTIPYTPAKKGIKNSGSPGGPASAAQTGGVNSTNPVIQACSLAVTATRYTTVTESCDELTYSHT